MQKQKNKTNVNRRSRSVNHLLLFEDKNQFKKCRLES